MKNSLVNNTELGSRILYLVISLLIYRLGVHIPIPGIDIVRLRELFSSSDGSVLQLFNLFSGGALDNASLLSLGVTPYISSSIVMQLMAHMYAPLKELRNQGTNGQKRINQYTRYLTLIFSLVQGVIISKALQMRGLALTSDNYFIVNTTIGLASGALFIMWVGEQITDKGIGNGISMLIFIGIAINMPSAVASLVNQVRISSISYGKFFTIMIIIILLFALIVFIECAQRRIAIHYAKQNRRFAGYASSNAREYIPLKINMASVIPAIFSTTIITLLISLLSIFDNSSGLIGKYASDIVSNGLSQGKWLYIVSFGLLVILFSFFYTAMVFENRDLADSLKKSNAFIQGLRPGIQTANYLDLVQERLTLVGAIYVAFVCIIPSLLNLGTSSNQIMFLFGGTSLLIVVVVAMDFMTQIQSHLLSQRYSSLMRNSDMTSTLGRFNKNKL